MKNENNVSLWLGNFENDIELEKYIKITYTEDGDSIPSKFDKDFHLGYYDLDFMESNFIKSKTNNLNSLIRNFSYGDLLIT